MWALFKRLYKAVIMMSFVLYAALVLFFVLYSNSKHPQPHDFPEQEIIPKSVAESTVSCVETDLLETEATPLEPTDTETPVTEPAQSEPVGTEAPVTEPTQTEPISTETPVTEPADTIPIAEYRPVESLSSLFIGDSRTVGLANYASIENADFFATIGMTVYNVWDARVSIPKIGKVSLEELLDHKQYDIIYIMLGVNELGYAFDKTVGHYETLVESVKAQQPDAIVILMANIHVTARRSESDKYINNPAIDRFNEATSRLADNRSVFYLDANGLFDDADGNLAAEKSADSAHLKAKYCAEWGDWLEIETADILLQAEGEKESD